MKTKSGFEYNLDKKRLDNYELVEALAEMDTNPLALPKVVNLLLGDQAKALKDHVRDEDGNVSIERMSGELTEMFENQQLKN